MNTKLPVSRIQCEPDRTYNKADDMHLRASIRSRLDKGLKPLLQPVALKKLENNPDYDYAVDDGRRRFLVLLDFKFTELELGQDAILIDGDSEKARYSFSLAAEDGSGEAAYNLAHFDELSCEW